MNACLSIEAYIESLERQRDNWYKEAHFQEGKNHGDTGVLLYWIAQSNAVKLEEEILTLKKLNNLC